MQERLEGRTMQVYRKEYDRMENMTYQETLIFPLQQIGDSRKDVYKRQIAGTY